MTPRRFRVILVRRPGTPNLLDDNQLRQRIDLIIRDDPDLHGAVSPDATPVPPWTFVSADRGPSANTVEPSWPLEVRHVHRQRHDLTIRRLRDLLIKDELPVELHSDLPLHATLWTLASAFGTRRDAHALIGADRLNFLPSDRRVNVVIVDQGFDRTGFETNYAGGWRREAQPGEPAREPGGGRSLHAAGVARTVLDLAPHARLYDAPLIVQEAPGARATIGGIPAFTADAAMLWQAMSAHIKASAAQDSWVLVNAWSIYDRATDIGDVHYCDDSHHVLNEQVSDMVATNRVDQVFAAGNCGQFQPDERCGPTDRGPCRSILGANSLDGVLTVASVRTNGAWHGYASQGPGQPKLGVAKPDLAAPSEFTDSGDRHAVYGGTSAAAAVAGGVVAALRARWDRSAVAPGQLFDVLRETARPMGNPAGRVGHGVVCAGAAVEKLQRSYTDP